MRLSYIQSGLWLLMLAAVQLALFPLFVGMMFQEKFILGAIKWGGLIPQTPGNWQLIFWIQALVCVAGIPMLAKFYYPQMGEDIKKIFAGENPKVLKIALLSGFSLFVAWEAIAIGCWLIPAGVVVGFFLIYPILTTLGAWKFWGYRPHQTRITAMTIVTIGSLFALKVPAIFAATAIQGFLGILAAIVGGIAFSSYLLLTYRGTRSLHPLPFSAIALGTLLGFASLSLILPLPGIAISMPLWELPRLMVGSLILGILALVGYAFTAYGILLAGVTRGATAIACVPALFVLFGSILIQDFLDLKQIFALVIVILGLLVLITEPMVRQDWYD
ncbi:DMT family transporter [Laspinema olomoucense]|uniref:DMT family transporter n=1 Tax=Laspinema olomoucense TaxID=3231600 RepID=UPI0021BA6BB4|nr:DMT family transporter [Laspinema sp. D3d]MCT7970902.1 DMT family transporter [Laspinema sp. D3d]